MFHGRDSPRTPARRPIASPGPPDAYSPFPSARASPGAALASHHHALSNAIDASRSSGRRSPRRGATHPAREGPSDWSSRAAEMEAVPAAGGGRFSDDILEAEEAPHVDELRFADEDSS